MKRSDIVMAGADQLFVTENAVDQALTEAGQLISTLTRLRVAAGVSAVVGDEAMQSVLEATASLGSARSAITRAHGQLDEVKVRLGCRTVAVGTGQDKPLPGSTSRTGRLSDAVQG